MHMLKRVMFNLISKGRNKRDVLSFRFNLARELIGGFCSHEKAGRSRSEVNTQFTSDRIKSQYQINSLI